MSIRNIGTPNNTFSNITVKDLVCEDCICLSNTIDNIFTQNIQVDPPQTEINFFSDTNFNNTNVIGINNLDVFTLNATNINGNITDEDINVNTISTANTGQVQFLNNVDMNNNDITNINNNIATNVVATNGIKLSNINDTITANNCLHVQSNQNACLFLESDTNNNISETDKPEIKLQRDGGATLYKIAGSTDNKSLQITSGILSGTETGTGDRSIEFLTTDVAAGSIGTPSFVSNPVKRFEITPTSNNSFVNLDMNNNDITNITNTFSNNTITTNAMKLSNVNDTITNNNYLHIQNTGSCGVFIEADTDDSPESDLPRLLLTQDSNNSGLLLNGTSNTENDWRLLFGNSNTLPQTNRFRIIHDSNVTTNGIGNQPSFNGPRNEVFNFGLTSNQCSVELDMTNNEITNITKSTGTDIVATNSIKLSNVNTDITAPGCLHLQSSEGACIFLQSNDDGVGNESHLFNAVRGNGVVLSDTYSYHFGMGAAGPMQYAAGNSGNNTSGIFQWFSSQFNYGNGFDRPFTSFTNSQLLCEFNNNNIDFFRPVDMNNNNINNANTVDANNLILSNLGNDDAATKLLVLDGSNNVDFRNVSSLPYTLTTGIVNQITSLTNPVRLDNIDNVIVRTVSGSIAPQGKVLLPFSSNLINVNSFVQVSCSDYKNGGNGILVVYSYKDISADTRIIVLANAHMTNTITDTFEITVSIRN